MAPLCAPVGRLARAAAARRTSGHPRRRSRRMSHRSVPPARVFAAVVLPVVLAACQPGADDAATGADADASPVAAVADAASAAGSALAPLPDARDAVMASMARFRE